MITWMTTMLFALSFIIGALTVAMLETSRLHRARRILFTDPGELDDTALREMLRNPQYALASPCHDRVQSAFERLLRERNFALHEAAHFGSSAQVLDVLRRVATERGAQMNANAELEIRAALREEGYR